MERTHLSDPSGVAVATPTSVRAEPSGRVGRVPVFPARTPTDRWLMGSPVGLALIDADLRIVRLNDTFSILGGRAHIQRVGDLVTKGIPILWDQIRPLWEQVRRGSGSTYEVTVEGTDPAGSGGTCHWSVSCWSVVESGVSVGVGVATRDITGAHDAELDLVESEQQFRELSERSQDVSYRVDVPNLQLEYVSAAVMGLTGYAPADFYADPELWQRLIHPDDRHLAMPSPNGTQQIDEPAVLRWITRSGKVVWTEHRSVATFGADGALLAVQGVARNVSRRVAAEEALQASETRYQEFLSGIQIGAVMLDPERRIQFINDHLLELLERSREEMLGTDWADVMPDAERSAFLNVVDSSFASGEASASGERGVLTASGKELRLAWTSVLERDTVGKLTGIASIVHDVTELHRVEAERALLAAAVAQTADAVIITDPTADIVFVNPAFERVSGYSRDDVIGQNPRLITARSQDRRVFDKMWSKLGSGAAWHGELANRRQDGSEYTNDVSITPVFDGEGALSAYISVQRDMSHVRAVEAELILDARVRGLLGEAIIAAAATSTLEDAAQAVCDGLVSLPGIDVAYLILFLDPKVAVVVAGQATCGTLLPPGHRLSQARSQYLRRHALGGPWGEGPGLAGSPLGEGMLGVDVAGLAFGTIGGGPQAIGVIAVGTCDPRSAEVVAQNMPALVAFGVKANTVLIERLEARRTQYRLRAAADIVLVSHAYHPVFQPIVELQMGETVGYEALTRFDSGQRPDTTFADAWSIGMGAQLELATIEAAVTEARGLPAGRWLHVNVSPRLLRDTQAVAALLMAADRPVVVEITEHELIDDYAAVRAAFTALGPDVRLAVDDAGIGIANFGHIVELRPDFVKIDISLIRRVNADPGRQALVAAMGQFARSAGCRLVAEGVESEAEARTLKGFGVEFAQGYYFGRPDTVQRWVPEVAVTAT